MMKMMGRVWTAGLLALLTLTGAEADEYRLGEAGYRRNEANSRSNAGAYIQGTQQFFERHYAVLPVSDEMDCRACHGSTSGYRDAKPNAGWVNDADPEKDYNMEHPAAA